MEHRLIFTVDFLNVVDHHHRFFFLARRLIAVCEHSFCGDVGVCIIIDSTFGCICPDGGISDRCSTTVDTSLSKLNVNVTKSMFAHDRFHCRFVLLRLFERRCL